jgi:hypothetical protein
MEHVLFPEQPDPDFDALRRRLKTEGLDEDRVRDILAAVADLCSGIKHALNPDITVLHSDAALRPTACTRIVVVRANGNIRIKRGFTLKRALEHLFRYYHACERIVTLGVVVADVWREDDILAYRHVWEHFTQRGVRTVYVLRTGKNLHPILPPWQ